MLALRKTLPSLASGSYDAPVVQGRVMAYRRTLGAQITLVVINYDTKASKLTLKDLQPLAALVPAYPVKAKPASANASGGLTLTLPAQSVRVYRLQL